MIDRSLFNAEDFLVDNTFQLYCSGEDKLCITYWENYIKAHPEQEKVLMEAQRLFIILSGNKKPLNKQLDNFKYKVNAPSKGNVLLMSGNKWLKIAAALIILAGVSIFFQKKFTKVTLKSNFISHFSTKGGERKRITLSDGSVILLNSKSSLTLNSGFNEKYREVSLIGEGYFDVTSNKNKAFIVHTADFDINVLGTTFTVKAYPGEATSETVLIRGRIVMESKGHKGSSITLRPSQKVTFYKSTTSPMNNRSSKSPVQHPEIVINHYTKINDSTILEMAWTQNRLEILDQNFSEVKNVLERWYNVDINLMDSDLEKYRFTATFNHESIEEVLNALQKAEHFKYEIKGDQITISR